MSNKENLLNYLLIIFFSMFLALASNAKLSGEDDLFWHLSTARFIIENGYIPSSDVFSYMTLGQTWIPFEWGWDVISYFVYKIDGFVSLAFFSTCLILLMYYILFLLLKKFDISLNLVIFCFIILTFGIMLRLTVKPHIISYLFLVLLLSVLVRVKYFNQFNLLYLVPVIFLVWMNMHLGVLAGIIMLSIFVFSEFLRYFYPRRFSPLNLRKLSGKQLLKTILIFILSLVVTLINPHGFKTYVYAYNMLNLKQIEIVYEWLSPFSNAYITKFYNLIYYIYLLGMLPVFYFSFRKKDIFPALLYLAFLINSTRSVRFTTDFLVAGTFFLILSLNFLINNFRSEKLIYFIQRSLTAKIILCVILLALTINVPNNHLYSLIGYQRMFGSGIDVNNFPAHMFNFIKQNNIADIGEQPFNTYETGGYFIWNFPGKKDFIDSRGINDDIWEKYVTVINATENYSQIVSEAGIDYFMWFIPDVNYGMNPEFLNYGIVPHLFKSGREWKLLYWDDNSLLFVKNLPKFEDKISEYEYKFITPYNYYYEKSILDSAIAVNNEVIKKELERKKSEDPTGLIINKILRTYGSKIK